MTTGHKDFDLLIKSATRSRELWKECTGHDSKLATIVEAEQSLNAEVAVELRCLAIVRFKSRPLVSRGESGWALYTTAQLCDHLAKAFGRRDDDHAFRTV